MVFKNKKSLGQNFLINENILELLVSLGSIQSKDTIIEIGPGSGNLTQKLIEKKPKELTVIEKDSELSLLLNEKFGTQVNIINQDILKFSYSKYKEKEIIIFGNLPYNISTQILVSWIRINQLDKFCKKFILLFQKEVADRIISKHNSKNYGRLSILTSWKMDIQKITDLKPINFKPKPKVDSTILILTPKKKIYPIKNCKNLEHVTNIFFQQRRKMIKKPLGILFKDSSSICKSLRLDLNLRPQNLSTETFFKICQFYENSLK